LKANGIVERGEVDRTSVWRACKRLGLPINRPRRLKERDMRRFAYPHRMMMVLADGKHFRAGASRANRVALTLLDDATRRGLGVVVATSESTEVFLEALHQTILQVGVMITLFLDNGPGFISGITRRVVAQLGIQLILGTPAYPEGHGKIERFNRRFKEQVLRHLDGNPAVDPDPASLTLRCNHWLTEIYNRDPHYGLGKESPLQRWDADERELVLPPEGWQQHFVITFDRKVSNDNVISYNSVDYEVPRGSAGRTITVSRHLLDDNALTVIDQGRVVTLHPVDLTANAHARRARRSSAADAFSAKPQQSAAAARFDADMEPLVGSDGGYKEGQDDE
jgi:transposase InsO family protein